MISDHEKPDRESDTAFCDSLNVTVVRQQDQQKKSKATKIRKAKILAAVIYGNLFLGCCYSLMAPFLPAEAERKKASATEYGFIFGIYQLIQFLVSPIYGKWVRILKPGFMMKAGMLVSGLCNIMFGFLNHAPDGKAFVGLAFVIRIIDALGAASFLTASYTTLGCELPEIIGRAMSVTETAFAFGLASGPVLGGFLYEAGGFSLPFIVVGILLLTGTAVNFFLFTDSESEDQVKACSAKRMLANIDFLLDALSICTCFAVLGFNEATLEPHIRKFNLAPSTVGLIFLISGLTDALVSPIWGYFAEKVNNAQFLTLLASLMFVACFLIIGPVPFLSIPKYLSVIVLSQFLLGLGMAGGIVCSFTHGMKHTVERGFPDDVGTFGLISGVLFSVACFGAFIGPSLGGFLIDTTGYENATVVVTGVQIFMSLLLGIRLAWLYLMKGKKIPEKECVLERHTLK